MNMKASPQTKSADLLHFYNNLFHMFHYKKGFDNKKDAFLFRFIAIVKPKRLKIHDSFM